MGTYKFEDKFLIPTFNHPCKGMTTKEYRRGINLIAMSMQDQLLNPKINKTKVLTSCLRKDLEF